MLKYNAILRTSLGRNPSMLILRRSLIDKPVYTRFGAINILSRNLGTTRVRFFNTPQPPSPHHTKEQLLAQSRHFLDRLKIRFKWTLIRQNRPFNIDEISAFISWIVMGNLLWFFIGTTTFVSLVFYLFDKFVNDQSIRNKYLLKLMKLDTSDLDIVIDKNFSVSYEDGYLKFQNVKVNNLKIKSVNLKLSFSKWKEGRGLIKDLQMKGVRGNLNVGDENLDESQLSQLSMLHSNYELDQVVISDSLVYVNGVKLQLFHAQLPKLRMKWFFYDIFNSDNCTGAINDSLFTIHIKQTNRNYASFEELEKIKADEDISTSTNGYRDLLDAILRKPMSLESSSSQRADVFKDTFKQVIRFRIDELDLEQLPKSSKFDWLKQGKMEMIADIMFPEEPETTFYETRINDELKGMVSELYNKIFQSGESKKVNDDSMIKNNNSNGINENNTNNNRKYVMIDFKFQFKELKCSTSAKAEIDPELIKFINMYDPDKIFDMTSNDLDTLISSDDFTDEDDQEGLSLNLPSLNFRIIENIELLTVTKLSDVVLNELINNLNHLKLENDIRLKRYKDTSFLIKNLILVGLGVCFI